MGEVAIRVEHLGKQYRLGSRQASYQTFREALVESASAPLRWLKGERASKETFWALEDVSFEVKHGEAVGIIGRNGAGKSTLLKVLSSITAPTRGRVELFGRVGSLLEVGTGFHPELTGRENIYLNGAILGMSRQEITRKFDEIVDFAEVEMFLDTPVKFYSSGMYVRLAFAVAAHLEPEILLVDEVLAVGDAQFQKKSIKKMSSTVKGGRTVMFISHNMSAINQFCNNCFLIDKGKIIEFGPANEVIQKYLIHGNGDKAFVEIEPDRHVHKPRGLEFKRIEIGFDSKISNQIPFGSPIEIKTEFETSKSENIRLGLVISTSDGNVLASIHEPSLDTNKNEIFLPGKYLWETTIDIPLMPGSYLIDLFAKPIPGYWGSSHASLDWVQGAMVFQVEEINKDGRKVTLPNGIIAPSYSSKYKFLN